MIDLRADSKPKEAKDAQRENQRQMRRSKRISKIIIIPSSHMKVKKWQLVQTELINI